RRAADREEGVGLSDGATRWDPEGTLDRAAPLVEFSGKAGTNVEVLVPVGSRAERLVAIGVGKTSELDEHGWMKCGGTVAASLRKNRKSTVVADLPDGSATGRDAAALAAGMLLRTYSFDRYKTRKEDTKDKTADKPVRISIQTNDP